ncbi:acetyltransferase [Halovivax ruber XH-70]|uniref:Acetyltransferase n=1 Tax=Halovivax ruber (strain DSM 18193 / JCM 13892 / XH-70) TaxID=797302 RepID=L0IAW1_HALRX|nr:GNAT family N-acetyltransferase [Halovivax ruber]AGB15879.1 acetyltransferase [Halovivax ruber XH-70]
MTSDATIRRATHEDAAAIAACYRDAYRVGAERGFPTRMTEIGADTVYEWLDADAITLVAEPGETNVGDGGSGGTEPDGSQPVVGTVRLLEERETPYIERLAVVESWQGNGLGQRLFDRAESIVQSRGYDTAQLTTYDTHPFLYEWYESQGYEPIETHEKPDRPYDYVTMERRFE